MKPIYILFSFLILLSCAKDDSSGDDGNKFVVNVTGVGNYGAHIAWNTLTEGNSGVQWKYRIVLNNNTVIENLEENTYHFNYLHDETEYSGTVYGADENGNETSDNFNFTTTIDEVCYQGHINFGSQNDIIYNNDRRCRQVQIVGEDITDLTPLSDFEYISELSISNTSLRTLDGLQNVKAPPGTTYIIINIRNNRLLEDISALEKLFSSALTVYIISNENLSDFTGFRQVPSLKNVQIESSPLSDLSDFNLGPPLSNLTLKDLDITNLNGFEIGPQMKKLSITSCPITDLGDFGTVPLDTIILKDLPIPNFSAFRNTPSIKSFTADSLPNITGFAGFDHIESLSYLRIRNNPVLTNLNDLETLRNSGGQIGVEIKNNPNLVNYCGIREWMLYNEILLTGGTWDPYVYHFWVNGNGYNPTEFQMRSPTGCHL